MSSFVVTPSSTDDLAIDNRPQVHVTLEPIQIEKALDDRLSALCLGKLWVPAAGYSVPIGIALFTSNFTPISHLLSADEVRSVFIYLSVICGIITLIGIILAISHRPSKVKDGIMRELVGDSWKELMSLRKKPAELIPKANQSHPSLNLKWYE